MSNLRIKIEEPRTITMKIRNIKEGQVFQFDKHFDSPVFLRLKGDYFVSLTSSELVTITPDYDNTTAFLVNKATLTVET